MTRREALKILNLDDSYSKDDLKKKYRALMMMLHPDMNRMNHYPYDASDINLAYEYLKDNAEDYHSGKNEKEHKIRWSAPVNVKAYKEREILHYVEDYNGDIIANTVIDQGKYYWIQDEEFPLFFQSIVRCAKKILEEYDEKYGSYRSNDYKLLSELIYLIALQYVNPVSLLELLDLGINEDGEKTYQAMAMIETGNHNDLKPGDMIFPFRMREHKLYVCDRHNSQLGYISFKDDKLYYAIIPLLERKAAKIKMIISEESVQSYQRKNHRNVIMYIRLIEEEHNSSSSDYMDSINAKISDLLENGR